MNAALWVIWALALGWLTYLVAGALLGLVGRQLPWPSNPTVATLASGVSMLSGAALALPLIFLIAGWGDAPYPMDRMDR